MHTVPALAIAILVTTSAACQQDLGPLERKLDKLQATLDKQGPRGGNPAAAGAQPRPRRPEPDPKAVFAVSVDGNASDGPADAPVTIVEGYEYACPACKNARTSVAQLKEKYGDKVRVVYKQYIVHPDVATSAAFAICAANRQNKFTAMDKVLWEKGFGGGRDFSPPKLEAFATEAGLDLEKFKADMTGPCQETVMREHQELAMMGQAATPTFFINGRYVVGASPQKLGAVIDEELATAEQRITAGTKRADYYKTWVIEKGAKKFDPPQS